MNELLLWNRVGESRIIILILIIIIIHAGTTLTSNFFISSWNPKYTDFRDPSLYDKTSNISKYVMIIVL